MPTTTELTESFIDEHASIKYCLKNGLINYSALSRLIAKDIDAKKSSSIEAILIAARRYREKIRQISIERDVIDLFRNSNMEIKNNIVVFTLEKNIYPDTLIDIEKNVKKDGSLFFAIEGTRVITVIMQRQNGEMIEKSFKKNIIEKNTDLSIITINSKGISKTLGVIGYLTSMFFEKGINIEEFMSCHDDTLIVLKSDNVEKIMRQLNF